MMLMGGGKQEHNGGWGPTVAAHACWIHLEAPGHSRSVLSVLPGAVHLQEKQGYKAYQAKFNMVKAAVARSKATDRWPCPGWVKDVVEKAGDDVSEVQDMSAGEAYELMNTKYLPKGIKVCAHRGRGWACLRSGRRCLI